MALDPTRLTDQGLKDGIASLRQLGSIVDTRLREAEGRLAAAEQDLTEFRKLASFVREVSDAYRVRLALVQSEAGHSRPSGGEA